MTAPDPKDGPTQAQIEAAAKAMCLARKPNHPSLNDDNLYWETHKSRELYLKMAAIALTAAAEAAWPSDELVDNLVASATEEDNLTKTGSHPAAAEPPMELTKEAPDETIRRLAKIVVAAEAGEPEKNVRHAFYMQGFKDAAAAKAEQKPEFGFGPPETAAAEVNAGSEWDRRNSFQHESGAPVAAAAEAREPLRLTQWDEIAAAKADMKERCAQVADSFRYGGYEQIADAIAAAIRQKALTAAAEAEKYPRRGFSSPGFEQGTQSEWDAVEAGKQIEIISRLNAEITELLIRLQIVETATIERCAKECDDGTESGEFYAAKIRAVKEQPEVGKQERHDAQVERYVLLGHATIERCAQAVKNCDTLGRTAVGFKEIAIAEIMALKEQL